MPVKDVLGVSLPPSNKIIGKLRDGQFGRLDKNFGALMGLPFLHP